MSDVVLRQKVGIPAGIDERVVDAGEMCIRDRYTRKTMPLLFGGVRVKQEVK